MKCLFFILFSFILFFEVQIVAQMDKDPYINGFTYLGRKTYSCGGQTHTVQEYRHNQSGLEFVKIPQKNYMISKTEVTQGAWCKVMGTAPWTNGPYVKEGYDYPAVYVNWYDALDFCQKTGLRLPSVKEWEYAYRAGTKNWYYWGARIDGRYCWYKTNAWDVSEKYPHKVKQKLPNAFGLYDMAGNVWEWAQKSSGFRLARGGGWSFDRYHCTYKFEFWVKPDGVSSGLGFRVVTSTP